MGVYDNFPSADFVLEDMNIELSGQNPFGSVKHASLKILGNICQVLVRFSLSRPNQYSMVRDLDGDWDSELLDMYGRSLGDVNLDREPGTESIYAVLLAISTAPELDDYRWQEWNMLLITPVLDRDNVFERIGIACIHQIDTKDEFPILPEFERRSFILV
jgi:hypothetical protein